VQAAELAPQFDGCLYGLVDDVPDGLCEPVGGVAHRGPLGSSVR